jgi:hypothetical protein
LEWSETTYSPDFTDEDIDAHLDWQYQQDLICQGCGHPIDESHDEDIRAAWVAERRVCWGCAAKERTQRGDNSGDKRPGPGTKYVVRNRMND